MTADTVSVKEVDMDQRPVDGCCSGCLLAPVAFFLLSVFFGPVIGFIGTLLIVHMVSSHGPEEIERDHRDPP